ncbi:hypothetical protein [Prauserella cavernicola]|uniref:Uncharacterized protein n=1 Tax=Prauserella cavernicola TaxID=2800127 RepID=A0A934V3F3_9PSEU|nr:hypothetical protein [Prauserella cavernicola]MBK1782935.1 hypothetical protein [Prauserella cavernicola]
MTYPPPPPGGPGQPGPHGQQGLWGQQPQQGGQFPPSGPTPQEGGLRGTGGEQQFGQPGQFGQFGQPGQFGQFGDQPPGFPGGPDGEPPKKKTGLIVGIAIAAIVVIGGVVALILFLTSGDDEDGAEGQNPGTDGGQQSSAPQVPGAGESQDPGDSGDSDGSGDAPGDSGSAGDDETVVQELADRALESLTTKNAELAKEVSCDPDSIDPAAVDQIPDGTYSQNGDIRVEGDTATIPVTLPGGEEQELTAAKENGAWCVNG